MRRTLLLGAAALLIAAGPVDAAIDTDKASGRITMLAAFVGQAETLAINCHVRDTEWADDLETEFALEATAPDVKTATDDEVALESRFADAQLEKVKGIVQDKFDELGAKEMCPDLLTTPGLGIADRMVKQWRKPKDWSGAGGIR